MATQKLQPSDALEVIPSDNADIPFVNKSAEGTNTSATTNKLVDSGATFNNGTVNVGDIVYNITDATAATVTDIDSATTLSLNADIFAAGSKVYIIYARNSNQGCVLYVGGAGDLKVTTASRQTVLFKAVPVGTFIPINVVKVFDTDTTATFLLALW